MDGNPDLTSRVNTGWFLLLFGGLAAITVVAAARRSIRTRDPVPVVLCLGALLCAVNEPIYDLLGELNYAHNASMAYHSFGRGIPWFLVLGYVPWVAGLSYAVARLIERGAGRALLHWIAFGSFVSVTLIETSGNLTHAWLYYGEPPLKYLGVSPGMAGVPIVCGVLVYILETMLTGARRLLIGLVPIFSLPAVYAAGCGPMYTTMHADVSKAVQYLAALVTLALISAIVAGASAIAMRWRASMVDVAETSPVPVTVG